MDKDINKIQELLNRRVDENGFFPSRDEIEKRLAEGNKLSFYYGIDPTGKDIHLGHTVQLFLLKELINFEHKVTLLIGDFTAKIGDPTGKDKTRKPLTDEDIHDNMKTYLSQVEKILPKKSFEVKYNSEWLKDMSMEKVIELASQVTVQQMIIRDMFQERINSGKPIGMHEFLYPLMQGYDSVAMGVDGEVGGHDQIFNMLVGRDLEKKYLGKDKMVLATKLLIDSSTGKKMSKSEGEIIAIGDEPSEIRRKILAMNDGMTKTIFELCTDKEQSWIDEKHKELAPKEYKELLCDTLVAIYHGENSVKEAHEPKELSLEGVRVKNIVSTIAIGFALSNSEAKRLIDQGAVEVNNKVIKEWDSQIKVGDNIKLGKGKFLKIK